MSHSDCVAKLKALLALCAGKRANGEIAANLTTSSYGSVLKKSFKQLHLLGYKLDDPQNLKLKHIEVLCRHWLKTGKKVSTIQTELSILRNFCTWIGKSGMIKSLVEIVPDVDPATLKNVKLAKESKSWTENGIDVAAKIQEADELDWRFGLMLRMSLAFGLRRIEVLQLQPISADLGDMLALHKTKNGRPRMIPIDTPEQRSVLDFVKSKMKSKNALLGWEVTTSGERATLKYSVGRYNRLMARMGVTRDVVGTTGHGLRAQFAENAALIASLIPPTLGGTGGQLEREELNMKRARVSEQLGHSRISITGAYYGSFGREGSADDAERAKRNIESSLQKLSSLLFVPVSSHRQADCIRLIDELAYVGIEITVRQVHLLWCTHSQRHAQEWIELMGRNVAALEAAALALSKQGNA